MKLQLSPDQARRQLAVITHAQFQQGLERHWQVGADRQVRAQSILWLFCWAKTGQNSETAAEQARQAFQTLFGRPYAWFEARIPHEYARSGRYATGDLEAELAAKLR
jgi:hypothetical protein